MISEFKDSLLYIVRHHCLEKKGGKRKKKDCLKIERQTRKSNNTSPQVATTIKSENYSGAYYIVFETIIPLLDKISIHRFSNIKAFTATFMLG